ncbi:hypothetical protein BH23VER1_BH23VER1_28370 [soil metagenome]
MARARRPSASRSQGTPASSTANFSLRIGNCHWESQGHADLATVPGAGDTPDSGTRADYTADALNHYTSITGMTPSYGDDVFDDGDFICSWDPAPSRMAGAESDRPEAGTGRHTPFGVPRFMGPGFAAKASSGEGWNLLYSGQFYDIQSGFYNYGFRYYSPETGRFLSRDPFTEHSQLSAEHPINFRDVEHLREKIDPGLNEYAIVENSPTSRTDVLGYGLHAAAKTVPVEFSDFDPPFPWQKAVH